MQVDRLIPVLKPPGTERLTLKCDVLLSTCAFEFKFRHHNKAGGAFCCNQAAADESCSVCEYGSGKGLHSSTSHLNLSRF